MDAQNIEKALRRQAHRPLSLRRVAEIKGCDEKLVRLAIERGHLPEPFKIETTTGGRDQRFFLAHQVRHWNPKRGANA